MINLTFFLDSRERLQQSDEVELQMFNTILEEDFAKNYLFVMEKQLVINTFYLEDSIAPFLENESVLNLLKKDGSKMLPIIIRDNQVIKTNGLFNAEEVEGIFDMGIAIQYSDDD